MASTLELQNTIDYARIYLRMMLLVAVGGLANEPAVTIGNSVMQYLLAPPLAWPWNRNKNSATSTVAGTQDYICALADFGWLEKATIKDASNNFYELETTLVSPEEGKQSRPIRIATQNNDGAGNITFRLSPVPDQAYTLNLTYQKKATLFTSLTQTWAPIPDEMSYLYTTGFLAKSYEMADDGRYPGTMQMFLNQIVGAANGLSDTQKNLFLWNRLRDIRQLSDMAVPMREGRNIERE